MSNATLNAAKAKLKRGFAWKARSLGGDLCLIVLVTTGCYFALRSNWNKSELDFHMEQLTESSTEMRLGFSAGVEDPDRIFVEAIETDKPLEFAWKVYLPAGWSKIALFAYPRGKLGGKANAPLAEPSEFVARFKMKLVGEHVVCEQHWLGTTTVFPVNLSDSKATQEYLQRADFRGAIFQSGRFEMQSFSKDDDICLLKLAVPYSGPGLRVNAQSTDSHFVFALHRNF